MNWIQILQKGKYPVFLLYSIIDGESANFLASTLAGNGLFNIFTIYIIAIVMEVLLDTIYYFVGRSLPLQQVLDKLVKTQKGKDFQKRIDTTLVSKPYLTAFIIKFSGPLAVPGLLYFGNKRVLKPLQFILSSVVIAIFKGIAVSFFGYMVGKGFGVFGQIYGTMHILGFVCIIAVLVFILLKVTPKVFRKE